MPMLRNQLRPAIVHDAAAHGHHRFVYPGVVTVLAQVFFPRQANGSLVVRDDGTRRGQCADRAAVHDAVLLPPAAIGGGSGYVGDSSGGTNKGPTDRKLADTLIAQAVDSAVKNDGAVRGQIPADMVTSSASGLDPDISPANADLQVARVARRATRRPDRSGRCVAAHTGAASSGSSASPRVNVLLLNLALDSAFPVPAAQRGTSLTVADGAPSGVWPWRMKDPLTAGDSCTYSICGIGGMVLAVSLAASQLGAQSATDSSAAHADDSASSAATAGQSL